MKMVHGDLIAVLCDFDGTLVDSLPYLFNAYRTSLANVGFQGSKEEFDALNGATFEEICSSLKNNHRFTLTQEAEFKQNYVRFLTQEEHLQKISLVRGVKEFLELSKKQKWKVAVVSSSKREWVEGILKALKITHFFGLIITGERVLHSKPNPEGYLLALKSLYLSSEQAVAVEDSPRGVKAAVGANLQTFAIQHPDAEGLLDPCFESSLVFKVKGWAEILEKITQERSL